MKAAKPERVAYRIVHLPAGQGVAVCGVRVESLLPGHAIRENPAALDACLTCRTLREMEANH